MAELIENKKSESKIKEDRKMQKQSQEAITLKTSDKTEVSNVKEDVKSENKEQKKEEAKKPEVVKAKKHEATANGRDLHQSPKDSMHICDMIRGRTIDKAMKMLEEVLAFKRVVRMNTRQLPHQHGKGVMAGRYPLNAAREFIRLLKQLKANAIYHELEIEKYVLFCKADIASKPYKSGGRRFKRTHVLLKLIENKHGAKKSK